MELFAGMFLMAKACMLLSQHKRFVECDLNPESINSIHPRFALVFVRQQLIKEL